MSIEQELKIALKSAIKERDDSWQQRDQLLAALIIARNELEAYEFTATGETYNSLLINAAIANATNGTYRKRGGE